MREVTAQEAVARLQPVCKNGAAGEGVYCTRPGLSKTSEQETHMPYQECTSVEVRLQYAKSESMNAAEWVAA